MFIPAKCQLKASYKPAVYKIVHKMLISVAKTIQKN